MIRTEGQFRQTHARLDAMQVQLNLSEQNITLLQQKVALQDQSFRSHVKSQNTQRITNEARDRLIHERRFGTEGSNQNNAQNNG